MSNCFAALFESSTAIEARRQAEANYNLKMKLIEGSI
jgi:hypothetical protein